MARPENKNVDYFPCYCRDGKVLYILESRWGNNGWAFFYKLWKMLGDADYHYIDLRSLDNWEFLRAKMGVSDAETTAILDKLSEMGVIDPELWAHRIVWSDSFVESVADAWKRRKQLIPQKPMFLIQKPGLSGTETPADTQDDVVSACKNTQRKGKERKGKERKEKNTYTPIPEDFSVSERVRTWATEKGFDRLEEHLEAFKLSCASKGYKYIDWDAAFMTAIRCDWARIRGDGSNGNRASPSNRHSGIREWLSRKQQEGDGNDKAGPG